MDKLPEHGKTTDKQNKQIQKSLRDLMQDLVHDDHLDPHHIDYDALKKRGIDEKTLAELHKLEDIYDEVDAGKPVDVDHLKEEMEEVIDEIEHEAHKKEDIQHHLEIIEKDLQGDKPLTKDQRNEIKHEIEHIIEDMCSDKNIDITKLTDKKLEEMDKIHSLREIYDDVNKNKPVDKKALADKIEHVEEEFRIEHKSKQGSKRSILSDRGEAEQIIHECEDLEAIMDKLPEHGETTDKQNKQIQKSLRDLIQDLVHDDHLDPHHIDYDALKKRGID